MEDAVIDGKTGLLAQLGDLKELSQLINVLVNDEKLWAKIGLEGKIWAKNFTWGKVAQELYNLD